MYELIENLLNSESFKSEVKFITRKFAANEKILEQGKQHRDFYLIRSGSVRVIVKTEINERSQLRPGIADLISGDVFGEFGLFDDLPTSADVIAVTESELIEIDIATFKNFLEKNQKIGYLIFLAMLKTLVKRLRHADKTILNLYLWGMKAHQLDKHLD
jgi:CRP/FNR family transcriptional regulator, cyclic AMP receptor protein